MRGVLWCGIAGCLVVLLTTDWGGGALARSGGDTVRGAHGLGGSTGEACVYCHAGALAGGEAEAVAPGGATAMCLGCHDGAMASDVAANTPLSATVVAVTGGGGSDHPVGIPLTLFSGAIAADPGQIAGLNRAVIDGELAWWIDTEAVPNGQRDATDLILYTRRGTGRPLPHVECATCHDPHDESAGAKLRVPNTGSGLCRTCHAY